MISLGKVVEKLGCHNAMNSSDRIRHLDFLDEHRTSEIRRDAILLKLSTKQCIPSPDSSVCDGRMIEIQLPRILLCKCGSCLEDPAR